jgi:hypothetical protein
MCNRDGMFRINLRLINLKYYVFRLHDVTFTSIRTSGLLLFQRPLIRHFPPSVHRSLSPNEVSYCTALKTIQEHPSNGEHKHSSLCFCAAEEPNWSERGDKKRKLLWWDEGGEDDVKYEWQAKHVGVVHAHSLREGNFTATSLLQLSVLNRLRTVQKSFAVNTKPSVQKRCERWLPALSHKHRKTGLFTHFRSRRKSDSRLCDTPLPLTSYV